MLSDRVSKISGNPAPPPGPCDLRQRIENQIRWNRSEPCGRFQPPGFLPASAVLSQEILRQDRESLRSAAVPIIAATPAEQKHQHDHQNDQLNGHSLSLPWAKTGPAAALNHTRFRSHAVTTSLAHFFHG